MKTCPHCGAQISETAKFCSECGYSFNGSAQPAKVQSKDFWVKLVPNVLFFVFALSLFGVLAEPVVSGLICANVYLLCDSAVINDTAISTLSILLVILVILTVVAAVVTAAVKYVAYKDSKPVNCKTDWISFACYMLYLLIGFVICIVVSSEEHLLVGACPVWLIIMPIIFTCLLGAFKAYIKYGATAPTATVVQSISDSTPSNQDVEQAENKNEQLKQKNSVVTARPKIGKALLPAILFLAAAAIMWVLYLLPTIRYDAILHGDYCTFRFNMFHFDFVRHGTADKMFINIFQYVLIAYLAVVSVAAVILLMWGILRIKIGNASSAKVCNKTLLISLIFYIFFFVLSGAMLLFTIMAYSTWFEVGCVAIISVAAIGFIGTIIAMVKIKKKRNKEAAENLE